MLRDVARQRHCEVEVQRELLRPRVVALGGQPPEPVDLAVVAALGEQHVDALDGRRLDGHEPVGLERAADEVQRALEDDLLLGEELGEAGDRLGREHGRQRETRGPEVTPALDPSGWS